MRNVEMSKQYIKHESPCLTTFQSTGKKMENATRNRAVLTNFELFGTVVKHFRCFVTFSQSKLKLRGKRRNKIVNFYAKYDQGSKHCHGHAFFCLNLMNYS